MSQSAARMNRLQIREQEQLNRERQRQQEAEAQRQSQAMGRTKEQYNHVKGHGYGRVVSSCGSPLSGGGGGDDVEIRVYVRECDGESAQQYRFREGEGEATGRPRLAPAQRPSRVVAGPAATSTGSGAPAATPGRGQVPRYLQHRKAELAAEKRAVEDEVTRRQELAKIPPGHRLVPEEEKAATVVKLEARKKELEAELGRIPLRFDTQAIRTRRGHIEDEMRQIETALLKYSTKKPLYLPL